MKQLLALYHAHGTKILGYAQAILAGWLLIPNLFPPGVLPYVHAVGVVLGVATIKRGHTNTSRSKSTETHDDGTSSDSQ